MKVLTAEWLKNHDACAGALAYLKLEYGDPPYQLTVEAARRCPWQSWMSWIVIQQIFDLEPKVAVEPLLSDFERHVIHSSPAQQAQLAFNKIQAESVRRENEDELSVFSEGWLDKLQQLRRDHREVLVHLIWSLPPFEVTDDSAKLEGV